MENALDLMRVVAVNPNDDTFGWLTGWTETYETVLKTLNNMYALAFVISDCNYKCSTLCFISQARKEVFDKMEKEFKIEKFKETPEDSIYIYSDCENAYTAFRYYYSPSNKKIYQERFATGN